MIDYIRISDWIEEHVSATKTEILRQLKELGISISRSRFYSWLEARGLHNKKAEFRTEMFFE